MRAVMQVSDEFLAERHRQGLDHWDEMWDGVLHLVPAPHGDHGRLNDRLGTFFTAHWEDLGLGRTYPEAGVRRTGAKWIKVAGERIPSDYKTPDRSFLLPPRYARFKAGWIVGAPDAVAEIVSPGDESYEKLPWYVALGVREAVYIDRVSREVEIRRAKGTNWLRVPPLKQGWLQSRVLDSELRREPDGRLRLRRTSDPAREILIGD